MDLYLLTLLLGFLGLTVMALAGLAGHGDQGGGADHDLGHVDAGGGLIHDLGHWAGLGHVGHADHAGGFGHDLGHVDGGAAGHDLGHVDAGAGGHDLAHADGGAAGHDLTHGDAAHGDVAHAGPGHGTDHGHGHGQETGGHSLTSLLLSWMSPRVIFGVLVGFGAAGMLLRPVLAAPLTAVAAVVAGIGFEAGLLGPVWSLMFRFAASPAHTLADAWMETATATTAFDAAGDGLVKIELNGEVRQILARLRLQDRRSGVHVRMGDRLRVEEVDPEKNACVVAWLGPGDEPAS